VSREGVIFKLIEERFLTINIVFFISKSSELLRKSTPNRGYLGSKSEAFRCRFCTGVAEVGVFSTPKIAVECMGIIDVAGKPRLPKEPRKSGYE
tara:strand:- start:16 stop:297 length:282 start_codon:yes stop_codon:yes gene_type:complete